MESELIDQYVEDALPAEERAAFEQYFLKTPAREEKLAFAVALSQAASARAPAHKAKERKAKDPGLLEKFRAAWRSLSPVYVRAAVVIAVALCVGLLVWLLLQRRPEEEPGLAILRRAYQKQRLVEARITSFDHAPLAVTRGPENPNIDQAALRQSELSLLEKFSARPDAATHHALGRFYLAGAQFDKAVRHFEDALKTDQGNAQLHSDLGAALLEAGKDERLKGEDATSLKHFARSLEHLDKALRLDPSLAAALFNRALCLQNMKLPGQARDAWDKYLKLDPVSEWAVEAKRNIQSLEELQSGARSSAQLLADFLAAYRRKDDERAWQIVSRNREMITGKLIARQLTKEFLSLSLEGRGAEAEERLAALKYAGELEYRNAGDPYFYEAAGFYSSASAAQRSSLARGQTLITEGHELCLRGKYRESLAPFKEARGLLEAAGDSWGARLADYWISYGYYQSDRMTESLALLSSLAEFSERGGYKWLLAQALSLTANAQSATNEFSKALEYNNRALAVAEAISDPYATQKALSQLANIYRYLGGLEQSLGYLHRCLRLAGNNPLSARQAWRNYEITSQTLYALGLYSAAAVYGHESLRLCLEEFKDPAVTYITYLHLGLIYGKLREFPEALRLARAGLQLSQSLRDESKIANSMLHVAHLNRYAGQCVEALGDYDRAVEIYNRLAEAYQRYDAHKGRLLCHLALGDAAAVERELPVVLGLFESYRPVIAEERNRNSFFDAEQGVYDIAIDFAYSKARNPELAFKYSEDSRARTLMDLLVGGGRVSGSAGKEELVASYVVQPADLSDIRARLPEQVQLIQYAVLTDKLLIWLLSRKQFTVVEKKVSADEVNARILNFLRLVRTDFGAQEEQVQREAMSLYELLIAPVEPMLNRGQVVGIIPDKTLSYLPFAALVSPSTGEYLMRDYALVSASSANVFLLCTDAAGHRANGAEERLLSVGNPSFDYRAFRPLRDLPSAGREAAEVAKMYAGASPLLGPEASKAKVVSAMTQADVIHFAGHYVVNERSPTRSKLLLAKAPPDEDAGVLRMHEIVRLKLERTRLIVLSACDTALERYYNGEGMVGLSRSFLAAGVPLVVASQWAVDSDATAVLMTSFHRHRKLGGRSTADALRRAQEEMLTGPEERYRRPYYWAGFMLVGGHAGY